MSLRTAAAACVAIIMLHPASGAAEKQPEFRVQDRYLSYAFGKEYKIAITEDMVKRMPEWPENGDSPPLSPRKALMAAKRAADSLVGPRAGFRRYIDGGICLTPVTAGWVWVIRFQWDDMERNSTGIPNDLVVVVLMDGSVVEPTVRDWNKGDRQLKKPK